MILVSRFHALNFLMLISIFLSPSPAPGWTIAEKGVRRPLILEGDGDVKSGDLPEAIRSAMRVDAVTQTVEWTGDRGRLRAVAGERMVVKNGRKFSLPRPVRFVESMVVFPEELLKNFADIFSFVEVASGQEGEILSVREPALSPGVAESSPDLREYVPPAGSAPPAPAGKPIRTIIIDPGHGGSDPGAKGKSGAIEKDIVLAIGLQTARALMERDATLRVILTRRRDEFISLHDRARLANTGRGDLFVSIHANSVKRNEDAQGFEIYHMAVEGANDDARAVAAFENAESQAGARDKELPAGMDPELGKILGDVMQLQYINASLELSKYVADHLAVALEGASKFRGSKGAFFYVLKDVMSPAILIEVGFVTNDWEASFLQKPWYQRKIADGVADGILRFKQAEDGRVGAPSAGTPTGLDESPTPPLQPPPGSAPPVPQVPAAPAPAAPR